MESPSIYCISRSFTPISCGNSRIIGRIMECLSHGNKQPCDTDTASSGTLNLQRILPHHMPLHRTAMAHGSWLSHADGCGKKRYQTAAISYKYPVSQSAQIPRYHDSRRKIHSLQNSDRPAASLPWMDRLRNSRLPVYRELLPSGCGTSCKKNRFSFPLNLFEQCKNCLII